MQKIRYEEMHPDELAAAREEVPLVYVPIGSIEYHGFHLPFGFDAVHAHELCLQAAEQTGGVVLPPTFWGTQGHVGFPGSLLLSEKTIAALMGDVFVQLTEQGYQLIVVCTGHYPQVQGVLIKGVADAYIAQNPQVRIMVLDPFYLHPTDPQSEHAGIVETSVMLYLRPDLVDMEQLKRPGALDAISPDCVGATAEYGETRFQTIVNELVQTVNRASQNA